MFFSTAFFRVIYLGAKFAKYFLFKNDKVEIENQTLCYSYFTWMSAYGSNLHKEDKFLCPKHLYLYLCKAWKAESFNLALLH